MIITCSLPTFENFHVGSNMQAEEPQSPNIKGRPFYPNKATSIAHYPHFHRGTTSANEEIGGATRKPMSDNMQPPPMMDAHKEKEQTTENTKILADDNVKDDLRKPPFKFPLKEYTEEVLKLHNIDKDSSNFNHLDEVVKPTSAPEQNDFHSQSLDVSVANDFEIPKFDDEPEKNIQSEIENVIESEKLNSISTDFYNHTIAEFFKKTKPLIQKESENIKAFTSTTQAPLKVIDSSSGDVVVKVTVKPLSFLQKVLKFKKRNQTSIDKVGKSPKPFLFFGKKKKTTTKPDLLPSYAITSHPPPSYSTKSSNRLKYTYTVFTSPPALQVTVRPHAYLATPVQYQPKPSNSLYEEPTDDHDKKFNVIDKFQSDFR